MDLDLDFLKTLLMAPGASSFEQRPAALWRERAERDGATVHTDAYGNVIARFNPGGRPRLLLAGHIDEIGLIVTHVDKEGMLYLKPIGGWDPQQLVGQRVRLVGDEHETVGVIGKKPVHLMSDEEARKITRIEDVWVDIGARDRDEALARVAPGDFAVIEQPVVELLNGRLASKAIDNRIGAFVALEAAKRAAAPYAPDAPGATPGEGGGGGAEVVAVATVQEEINGIGAATAAYALEPDCAIAIDVTHATDVPGVDAKREGEHPLASGPVLAVGSYVQRGMLRRLRRVADDAGIPYTIETAPRRTATDADDLARVRRGVPTAVVSLPNRYMHSPNEVVDPVDVEHTVALLAAFAAALASDPEPAPN